MYYALLQYTVLQDSWRFDKTCWSSRTLFKRCFPWILAKQLWSVSTTFLCSF